MKKNGFTLIELTIVVTIIVILSVILIGVFNSTGIFNKARDAQRKKDLGRIKVAFEEYYNDKGCYPDKTIADNLSSKINCGKNVFSPWLSSLPCDPNRNAYIVVVENPDYSQCNKWYKIFTKLEDKNDKDIPAGWTYLSTFVLGGQVNSKMVNYGVSSPNVGWFDVYQDPECAAYGGCYYKPDPNGQSNVCNSAGTGCVGPNCYLGSCKNSCQVACCGIGCH